jgi:translation initiation factor 5A
MSVATSFYLALLFASWAIFWRACLSQEDISPSTHNMDVPHVRRNEYQLVSVPRDHMYRAIFCCLLSNPQVNIDDGFLNLMNADGVTKDDVKVPEDDLGKQIQNDFDDGKELLVTIVAAMGEEQVSL